MVVDGDIGIDVSSLTFPLTIPNLALWLDATSGLYNQTSGGTIVTTDNSSIMRWEDKSGNYNFIPIAGLTSKAPVLKTNSLNNKNTIYFPGGNQSNSASLSAGPCIHSLLTITAFCVFISPGSNQPYANASMDVLNVGVYGLTENPGLGRTFCNIVPANNSMSATTFKSIGSFNSFIDASVVNTPVFPIENLYSFNKWYIYSSRYNGGTKVSSSCSNRVNTRQLPLGGMLNGYDYTLNPTSLIGKNATWQLGNRYAYPPYASANYYNDRGFQGNIAEILVYNSALTDQQMGYVEVYLVKKWGLDASGL